MDYIKIYTDFLKKFLKPQRKLKVVFDCSNGTAGLVLSKLLKATSYKLKAIFLNEKPDGNFPAHGPNPLKPGALKQLKNEVKKQKADLGIIFDADGDRVFFIDNLGRFINPDIIARFLIWHLKPKRVVVDIRTGWLVKQGIMNNELGIKNNRGGTSIIHNSKFIIQSKVGHYFIKNLMRKIKADFGAEYSGHYYFKKFFSADSGILAAIETINAVSKLPYRLSDFVDLLPQYYRSGELNFSASGAKGGPASGWKAKNLQKILKKIEQTLKAKSYKLKTKISHLDGLTMEFSDWWFNLRPSNTEPLIRLNIEATSKNLLNQKIKELRNLLKSF